MRVVIVLLLLSVFLMPLVLAEEQQNDVSLQENQEFTFGQGGNLIIPCESESSNGRCSAVTTCNLTTWYPNETLFLANVSMNNNGPYMSYLFTGAQTTTLGRYSALAECTDGVNNDIETFPYYVTPTGDRRNFSLMVILACAGAFLMISGLIFKNALFTTISGFGFTIAGVYILIYGFNNLNDLYTRSIGFITIGLGIYLIIASVYDSMLGDEGE